jgi:hypothetical protein
MQSVKSQRNRIDSQTLTGWSAGLAGERSHLVYIDGDHSFEVGLLGHRDLWTETGTFYFFGQWIEKT